MKKLLLITAVLLPAMTLAQGTTNESAIYDSAGTKIFSLVPTGETEETVSMDGVKNHPIYELTDLETGATYTYSYKWDQTISDGAVFMDYHFNKRLWYWVEGKGVEKGGSAKKDSIRRVYDAYEDRLNTPEQGEHPILRFKDGNYVDEMGRPVYALRGRFPEWCEVILLHKHYERVYLTSAFDEIKAFRDAEDIQFADANSLAQDLLTTGERNETNITNAFGSSYRMVYVAEIDGTLIRPSKEQIQQLKNKWLLAKDEPTRGSWGLVIPRAGYHLSSKEAAKRGLNNLESRDFVLELKPSPEYLAEFREAISQAVAAVETEGPAEAARQAQVDRLSVGILAGSLKSGSGNGYRTDVTFEGPKDVAVDSHGNVFVVDGHAIRKITPNGRVSTFAGGARGYVDGDGITARFATPLGIAVGADDNLYVADSGNRIIRKISPDGYVDTLAGYSSGNQDGWGPNAKFTNPRGIAVDAQGNVYVADDQSKKIRKVSPNGSVTTMGDEAEIKFNQPRSLAVDQAGNVYVLDGATLKRITPDGSVFLMAVDMTFDAAADATNRALFADAGGIAIDSEGNLLLTKIKGHAVIRISPSGETTTVAQNSDEFWLGRPNAVAVGGNGNVYLADDHNKVIHQVTPAGNTGPLPGMHIPQPAVAAQMTEPEPISKAELKALIKDTKKRSKEDPQAMFDLARLYEQDGPNPLSLSRAMASYKKAAKSGHAGAQYELALRHLDGTVPYSLTVTNGDVAAAERKQFAKRQVNAAELFSQSANQGYMLAQYALGRAYLNGEGVTQSTDTAIEWISKAGAQGLIEAQLDLGDMYHKGDVVAADPAKAAEWYALAAEQGDAYAEVLKNALLSQTDPDGAGRQINADASAKADLAFSHYTGSGAEQDFIQAAVLFQESALLGNTTAQWMIGRMCLNGEGMNRDTEQSLDWLAIAAQLGHPEAQFYLGLMYDRGYGTARDADNAHHWYTRSAEQGLASAQFALGDMYRRGDGRTVDLKVARDWFEKAAEQGDTHSQYIAGILYLDDTGGGSNGVRGIDLLEKAAAQGHVYATGRLSAETAP